MLVLLFSMKPSFEIGKRAQMIFDPIWETNGGFMTHILSRRDQGILLRSVQLFGCEGEKIKQDVWNRS